VRRPAIQKQFYDIEERVIVRPAGSALVELDEPISKTQKGATVVSPLVAPLVKTFAPVVPGFGAVHAAFPAYHPVAPVATAPAGAPAEPAAPQQPEVEAPQQEQAQQPQSEQQQQDLESVSIDNPEFGARTASPEAESQTTEAPAEPQQQQEQENTQQAETDQRAQLRAQQENAQRQQYEAQQREAAQQPAPQARAQPEPEQQQPEARTDFLGRQEYQLQTEARFRTAFPVAEARNAIPSFRNLNPEVNKANQERLIQLLTARGGVAEVQGYPPGSTRTNGNIGDAGTVRARVLSATPAPKTAEPTGERVNTRRIVVSRPIETIQEFDVVEPATKIHRINVQQPTFIKTARLGVARVPTSVPVYGKTLAHPIAYY
jgi:hypothetical protein